MSLSRFNPSESNIKHLNLEREPKSPLDLAREILGEKNVFSPLDAQLYWGISLTSEQRKILETIPFSTQELKECKDTHMLIAVLPISILEMDQRTKDLIQEKKLPPDTKLLSDASPKSWYFTEPFAKETGTMSPPEERASWQLLRKTLVPDSADKTYEQQLALLSDHEEVPDARTLIYSVLSHFVATKERLLSKSLWKDEDVRFGARSRGRRLLCCRGLVRLQRLGRRSGRGLGIGLRSEVLPTES